MRYQFLHIGKTGGTLVRQVLLSLPQEHRSRFHFSGHMPLARALEAHPEMPVFFAVRNPETLFVSGFNSRLRAGRPTFDRPWTPREQMAFSNFKTPNQLAESLSAAEPELKVAAVRAMRQIAHLRRGLSWFLHSTNFLEQHRGDIAFVLLQEDLEEDLRAFAQRVGVPLELARVPPTSRLHESMRSDETALSDVGLANVRHWYREHREIYDWCVDFHDRMLDGG